MFELSPVGWHSKNRGGVGRKDRSIIGPAGRDKETDMNDEVIVYNPFSIKDPVLRR